MPAAAANAAAGGAAGGAAGAAAGPTAPNISIESNSVWIPMHTHTPNPTGANGGNQNGQNDSPAGDNRTDILRNSESCLIPPP